MLVLGNSRCLALGKVLTWTLARRKPTIVVIIPKGSESPKAKPRDSNIPRVLLLLVNDPPNLFVPKAKPRDTNSISYYYFYSANVLNHLLIPVSNPWTC